MNRGRIAFYSFITILFMVAIVLSAQFQKIIDKWWANKVNYAVQKVDDSTNYETIKKVEDTCRAMISSYEADKLVYEQYKDSNNTEKQGWGEQAKMRANKTASTYNNYILQNSFVWEDNVPKDISVELKTLE